MNSNTAPALKYKLFLTGKGDAPKVRAMRDTAITNKKAKKDSTMNKKAEGYR